METFYKELSYKKNLNASVHVLDEDTRSKTSIPQGSIYLIVTSPPYMGIQKPRWLMVNTPGSHFNGLILMMIPVGWSTKIH